MSCCGRRTINLPPFPRPAVVPATPGVPPTSDPPSARTIVFEYVGRTGMTVVGGATGRRYRFDRPGARVAVAAADRASLAAVPKLRLRG